MGKLPETVNPTLDRQLARLRTRLAKTPLPGFFAWWGRELLACLPARWRAMLSERSESLLLGLDGDELVVWREKAGASTEYARIRRDQPVEAQDAEFRRLRAAIEDPQVRTVFCIPASRVLARVLSLPAAATDNLRQVLSFEMDRQTPFKADQVYFDSRVLGHDASGRNAQVELVLIPRAQLDQELGALPPAAAELDAVDSWSAAPGASRRQTNLLPPEKRTRRRDMRLPLNLGLAALAVVLLVVNMDESLANRTAALEAMQAEVEKAGNEAKQVAALRKTLADSISGANFLTDKKRKGPLTVALLDDLTRRLPEDTYLERLQIENKQVQLQGQANEAAKLIALLGASPCLGNPGFQGQVQPDARTGKERFQINADLKECSPQNEAKAPPKPEGAARKMLDAAAGDKQAAAAAAKSPGKDAPADSPAEPKKGDASAAPRKGAPAAGARADKHAAAAGAEKKK
ncbi:general secretion pathway protein L [Dokdonella fugitiva]|uniref:General secretion pathway protein L n=1 Tax=Dokdonella fugitiva TaxID=328517 RepID=A0A4R2IDM1_9GAMM|nr:general secretion pathway protein L [Dokdonella fugitiva]